MNKAVRILHLEDVPTDAELAASELKKYLEFEHMVIDSEEDFLRALEEYNPDVILCDHSLPSFNSLEALKIVKRKKLHIPFILITATMSEEVALSVVKEGADDFILKDRLKRLPSAVLNAVEKYRFEKERKKLIDDIHERESLANEQMQQLSLIAKETSNVVIITDAGEKITWVNNAFTAITEYTSEEAIGKKPSELLQGPESDKKTKAYLKKCIAQRQPFTCEIINYTKSGRPYWMEIKGQPLFNEKGVLKHFFAIQTDITARKEAENNIKVSEQKYRRLFHNSPHPKWIFNTATYQIVDVNEAACKLYGYRRDEFLQLKVSSLLTNNDEIELQSVFQSLENKQNEFIRQIETHRRKNGEVFYNEVTCHPIQIANSIHIIVTGMDMTEKLALQQQLIAEKVSAQKQVARAIINAQESERSEIGKELHDNVCQLLTTAKLYIENIKHMPEQQEAFTAKGLNLLIQSINEIRYLSRQLVSPVSGELDFESSINELLNHYRSLNLFEIQFTYAANLELVDKDLKTSIVRILQEQFNNTVKYAKASKVDVCITDKDNVLHVRYMDNGIGFDSTNANKGIGIANIKNRASSYRGSVNLTTAPGKGCILEISFPLK